MFGRPYHATMYADSMHSRRADPTMLPCVGTDPPSAQALAHVVSCRSVRMAQSQLPGCVRYLLNQRNRPNISEGICQITIGALHTHCMVLTILETGMVVIHCMVLTVSNTGMVVTHCMRVLLG